MSLEELYIIPPPPSEATHGRCGFEWQGSLLGPAGQNHHVSLCLVHLTTGQIEIWIFISVCVGYFISEKIKYIILIKMKEKQYCVLFTQTMEKIKKSISIKIEVNTKIKLELSGIHAFQDEGKILCK